MLPWPRVPHFLHAVISKWSPCPHFLMLSYPHDQRALTYYMLSYPHDEWDLVTCCQIPMTNIPRTSRPSLSQHSVRFPNTNRPYSVLSDAHDKWSWLTSFCLISMTMALTYIMLNDDPPTSIPKLRYALKSLLPNKSFPTCQISSTSGPDLWRAVESQWPTVLTYGILSDSNN